MSGTRKRWASVALALGLACGGGSDEAQAPEADSASGWQELFESAEAQRARRQQDRDPGRFRRREASPEELARLEAEFLARDARARVELEEPSAEIRAAALEHVDIEGPGRDRVFALARQDPDPSVRAAALGRVSEEESAEAIEALHAGLADADPGVVMAAIVALEAAGDASSVPYLERVAREHPDARVRERARQAADFLED